jgi:hypothetical protein
MKQPKMKIIDIHGKEWGEKNVRSINWDHSGNLWVVNVDFMGDDNSNGFLPFYNYTGEFVSVHGNLKGELIYHQ